MDDRYLNSSQLKWKLQKLLSEHGKLFIAYDFDDTVHPWFLEDRCLAVPHLLMIWKKYAKFIVYTSSPESRYYEIKKYLKDNGIPMDYINENPEMQIGGKVFYNVFLDDKAGLSQVHDILKEIAKEKGFWRDM